MLICVLLVDRRSFEFRVLAIWGLVLDGRKMVPTYSLLASSLVSELNFEGMYLLKELFFDPNLDSKAEGALAIDHSDRLFWFL